MGKTNEDENESIVNERDTVKQQETNETSRPSFFSLHTPSKDMKKLRGWQRKIQHPARK
ncbi:MAG: hypothetical protein NC321_11135 [Clostridium sp.]|nr:hypothetical protein [Clostridium sp.]